MLLQTTNLCLQILLPPFTYWKKVFIGMKLDTTIMSGVHGITRVQQPPLSMHTTVSGQLWHSKTTSALCKRLDATTNPVLSNIMTAGLYSYFQSKPLDRSEFSEYSASYHNLISLHESIG
jgi:hypothetical protein